METRFSHEPAPILTFSREGVRALDRAAAEDLGIPGLILMENAAAALEAAYRQRADPGLTASAIVLAGPGNNGGDGFALARRLANRGVQVVIALAFDPARAKGDAATNLAIVQRMGLQLITLSAGNIDRALAPLLSAKRTIVIDALLGTGADREPRGLIADAIEWSNAARSAGAFVMAVDIPSGLDCDSGRPLGAGVVHADLTVTLAGMKRGLRTPESRRWSGEVLVGDIGAPPSLLRRFADA